MVDGLDLLRKKKMSVQITPMTSQMEPMKQHLKAVGMGMQNRYYKLFSCILYWYRSIDRLLFSEEPSYMIMEVFVSIDVFVLFCIGFL